MRATCTIEGCPKPQSARGWCDKHYKRWENYGDPLFIARGREPNKVEIGERFGRLIVVVDCGRTSGGQRIMECLCDCGTKARVRAAKLRYGVTQSCGCLQRDKVRIGNTKHGLSRHPLYRTWASMRNRCNSPTNPKYAWYGGRGIYVDQRWADFAQFLADMGERPSPKHSIDRKDPDGPYSPENCRWATKREQIDNLRQRSYLDSCAHVTLDEEITKLVDAAREKRSRTDWVREAVLVALNGRP